MWERILTTDNLQRQQIVVIDWCYMYKRAGILVIIYSCIAWLLQSYGIRCFHYLGFIGLCQSVVELLDSWPGKFSRQKCGDLEHDPSLPYVGYLAGEKCSDL